MGISSFDGLSNSMDDIKSSIELESSPSAATQPPAPESVARAKGRYARAINRRTGKSGGSQTSITESCKANVRQIAATSCKTSASCTKCVGVDSAKIDSRSVH